VIVMQTRLSSRERQAMALLALEQTNKQIAFELGISASTVGVLLHRAAQKLGTRARSELIAQAKTLEMFASPRLSTARGGVERREAGGGSS
jgi:DNA-binding CsgD family transcriptional regulator